MGYIIPKPYIALLRLSVRLLRSVGALHGVVELPERLAS